MAIVAKAGWVSMDASTGMFAPQLTGLIAGEAIAAGDACRVHADGTVMRTDATAADALSQVDGFAPRAARVGEPVTIFGEGARFHYGAGLTPGATLYAAAAPDLGALDDAPTVGDPNGVVRVISATDIVVLRRK